MKTFGLIGAGAMVLAASAGGQTVFSAAGADAASITGSVDSFRAAISLGGSNNGVAGGPFLTGRREVNWDAPGLDAFQSPGVMPANFFNANSRRGAVVTTPDGTGVLVSKRNNLDVSDPARKFGDINPAYATQFSTFSPLRLFGVRGGVVSETTFFVPNEPSSAATVNGFGVVFTDVDVAGSSGIELFDEAGLLLASASAAVSPDAGLSFLGIFLDPGQRVFRARVTSGNLAMSATALDGGGLDVVAMDDFFYSEPVAIPAPASALVLMAGALAVGRRRR